MSDEKKKAQADGAPSANEIIEALAQEMRVTEKGAEPSEAPAAPEPAAASEAEGTSQEAAVEAAPEVTTTEAASSKKGDKKDKKAEKKAAEKADAKAPATDPKAADPKPAQATTPQESKKMETAAQPSDMASKNVEAEVLSLFDLNPKAQVDLDALPAPDVDEDAEMALKASSRMTNMMMMGAVAFIVLSTGVVIVATGMYKDLPDIFKGTYRDKKDAEARRIQEEHLRKQKEALEKYGNLQLTGEPNHALIKVQMEGDPEPRPLYAQFAPNSPFTELRLPTNLQNLKVKKPIQVRVEAPGYQPKTITLTLDMWQPTSPDEIEFQYNLTTYLDPATPWDKEERDDRAIEFEEELDGKVNGTIKVESNPPGARIRLNKREVIDAQGNPVVTPATLTALMADPEEKDPKKVEESKKPLKINTPPDNGYKVEVYWPDAARPSYVTAVQRTLWDCKKKPEDEIKKLGDKARAVQKCNYEYTVKADFDAIDAEIRRQKTIEDEIKKQKEEAERIKAEQAAGAAPKK